MDSVKNGIPAQNPKKQKQIIHIIFLQHFLHFYIDCRYGIHDMVTQCRKIYLVTSSLITQHFLSDYLNSP